MLAKALAQRDGKSIYALTLKEHPFKGSMHFEIWSTQDQNIRVSLKDINTGAEAHSTSISLAEGVNRNEILTIPGNLRGNYLLVLESAQNNLSRTVRLN